MESGNKKLTIKIPTWKNKDESECEKCVSDHTSDVTKYVAEEPEVM